MLQYRADFIETTFGSSKLEVRKIERVQEMEISLCSELYMAQRLSLENCGSLVNPSMHTPCIRTNCSLQLVLRFKKTRPRRILKRPTTKGNSRTPSGSKIVKK